MRVAQISADAVRAGGFAGIERGDGVIERPVARRRAILAQRALRQEFQMCDKPVKINGSLVQRASVPIAHDPEHLVNQVRDVDSDMSYSALTMCMAIDAASSSGKRTPSSLAIRSSAYWPMEYSCG